MAFSVSLSSTTGPHSSLHTLIYKHIFLNTGYAYDANTGTINHFIYSRGENQKGVSDIFGEMERYIYQMKALNELFLLAQVLSSTSVHIVIINNWNQYTKLDKTMVKYLFWLL